MVKFTINDKPVEITSPAQLISASIGQGINNYTPLQLASYVSTIANGGTRYKLHIVDKITDNDGNWYGSGFFEKERIKDDPQNVFDFVFHKILFSALCLYKIARLAMRIVR